jgi:hypothetical protein
VSGFPLRARQDPATSGAGACVTEAHGPAAQRPRRPPPLRDRRGLGGGFKWRPGRPGRPLEAASRGVVVRGMSSSVFGLAFSRIDGAERAPSETGTQRVEPTHLIAADRRRQPSPSRTRGAGKAEPPRRPGPGLGSRSARLGRSGGHRRRIRPQSFLIEREVAPVIPAGATHHRPARRVCLGSTRPRPGPAPRTSVRPCCGSAPIVPQKNHEGIHRISASLGGDRRLPRNP